MLFKNKYFFLSTFYPCDVEVTIKNKNYIFKNVESAFQCRKNEDLAENFLLLKGLEAKKLGEQIEIKDPNWNVNQLYSMGKALHSKFKNFALFFQLKLIKEDIINENFWGDTFWGVYKGEGYNILGKMLMNIRDNGNDWTALLVYINMELVKYV